MHRLLGPPIGLCGFLQIQGINWHIATPIIFCFSFLVKIYTTFNENLLNLDSSYIEVKGAEFLHLSKSLRIQVDDEVEVFDGKGSSCKAIVKELHKSYLILYL